MRERRTHVTSESRLQREFVNLGWTCSLTRECPGPNNPAPACVIYEFVNPPPLICLRSHWNLSRVACRPSPAPLVKAPATTATTPCTTHCLHPVLDVKYQGLNKRTAAPTPSCLFVCLPAYTRFFLSFCRGFVCLHHHHQSYRRQLRR